MTLTTSNAHHSRSKLLLGTLIIFSIAVVAIWFFATSKDIETNDAQIDGHIHPLSARIAGTVSWVNPEVEDTRLVKQGTILARLDPDDYSPAVEHMTSQVQKADADLEEARLSVPTTRAQVMGRLEQSKAAVAEANAAIAHSLAEVDAAKAQVATASAEALRARQDFERYAPLLKDHEITKSEYDRRKQEADAGRHRVEEAKAQEMAAHHAVVAARGVLQQRQAELMAASPIQEMIQSARARVVSLEGEAGVARSSLRRAKLDLGYTDIVAPVAGIIGKKDIEVGQRVTAGDVLMTVSPLEDVWVIANYRETQLRHVAAGDTVKIHVDTYNRTYRGAVESIGGATGARYSPLPPENATGNFVKVVQRIPVRIRIERDSADKLILVPGMSVETTIRASR